MTTANKTIALARLRTQGLRWQPDPACQILAIAPIMPLKEMREYIGLFLEDITQRIVRRVMQSALMVLPFAIMRYHRHEMRRCEQCPECKIKRTYSSLCLSCDVAKWD